MPTIRLNDCNIYYETAGDDDNQPLVLLHAFPLDHRVWHPQIHALSKDYWIIAPDFRGHGRSEATHEPYSMDLLARDVKALVESISAKDIVLGGISMGGYVAMAYTRLYSEDLQALVLADTKMEADTQQARQARMEQANTVLTKGTSSYADFMLPRLFSKENIDSNAPIVQEARRTIEAMNPMGIVGALQGMMERSDSTLMMETLRLPTLVVVGEKDGVTTVEDAKRMAGKIVNSELVIIPGAAHISPLEQPERVTSTIQTFLSESQLSRLTYPV